MKRFKVIAEKGVFLNGKQNKYGSVVTGELKQAHITTALHFKQIVALPDAPEVDPEAEAKAKADADAKAAEEAAAKAEADAKAEAEAKANQKKK